MSERIIHAENVTDLKARVAEAGSFFFTPATMKFFGTRSMHLVRGTVLVGHDTNAPEGVPAWWARTFTEATGGAQHIEGSPFHTREEAVAAAKAFTS